MDNITHTLIGITLGKVASRKQPKPLERAAVWTAIIGSNFPDCDFVVRFFSGHGEVSRLATLLHHRGLTHSIWAAIPFGFLAALGGCRIGGRRFSWGLGLLGILSVLLHVFSDYWNEYGVHPFSPAYDGWFYGDSIFILEPAFWLLMAPLALGGQIRSGVKSLWWIPVLGILGALWSGRYASFGVAGAMTVLFGVSFWVYRKTREPLLTLVSLSALLILFGIQGHRARSAVMEALKREETGWHPKTSALLVSPAPANPFCWRVMVAAEFGGDRVTANGVWSSWPSVFDPKNCYFREAFEADKLEPGFQPALLASTDRLQWKYEFRASLSELRELHDSNAAFRHFLGFARFPYWKIDSQRGKVIFGDLRFLRGAGRGFSEFEFPLATVEGEHLPQWKGVLDEIR